jgi:hypothetical protein
MVFLWDRQGRTWDFPQKPGVNFHPHMIHRLIHRTISGKANDCSVIIKIFTGAYRHNDWQIFSPNTPMRISRHPPPHPLHSPNQMAGWQRGRLRGKSGLQRNRMAGNPRPGQPEGQCHREQTAEWYLRVNGTKRRSSGVSPERPHCRAPRALHANAKNGREASRLTQKTPQRG